LISQDYISIPALAKVLGISRIAVYKKVKKGQIKGVKVGRNYVVSKKDINKTIDHRSYITIPQLARELGVSRVCIHQRVKRGLIDAKKVGRHFVIPKDYLHTAKKEEQHLSIPQLAEQAGVSRIALFKRVKNGSIRAEKSGKKFVISAQEAQKCLKHFKKRAEKRRKRRLNK